MKRRNRPTRVFPAAPPETRLALYGGDDENDYHVRSEVWDSREAGEHALVEDIDHFWDLGSSQDCGIGPLNSDGSGENINVRVGSGIAAVPGHSLRWTNRRGGRESERISPEIPLTRQYVASTRSMMLYRREYLQHIPPQRW